VKTAKEKKLLAKATVKLQKLLKEEICSTEIFLYGIVKFFP